MDECAARRVDSIDSPGWAGWPLVVSREDQFDRRGSIRAGQEEGGGCSLCPTSGSDMRQTFTLQISVAIGAAWLLLPVPGPVFPGAIRRHSDFLSC
jgi:hypothetical protein